SLLDTATITITTNSSGNFLYQLDNNTPQSNPIFENVFAGGHTLTVYDQNVCENSVSKTIFIVSYPKFFTPNNDGYNDVWTIQESDYFKIKSLAIFDRYGKLIKELNKTSKEWNGTYNGQNIRSDDYWFTLTYIENGFERTFKSHFSLKR
ncbi:T9SS type B sorting domain-containing protein, partial [Flavobacterium sp.]|uniref:T9SS type B sorting domain-containing protein n=1 Tax=Flavobacterium sp. TaxID=239 RepID=UPI002617419B